jgi:2-polyprenyl-3-methyl-5-hydroxy-6-metoxy-1,4-benzoquinol methylase
MSLHEIELQKYNKMWDKQSYRQWSPGENAIDNFLKHCAWKLGDTLVDLGCGTGRAGAALAARGLKVVLLDFCTKAVDVEDLPVITANIWELFKTGLQWDWVYCVDVLEHIPEEKIDDALRSIAQTTRKGGYLQIAMFEDYCGREIGETLHMTVKNQEWWYTKIFKHMNVFSLGNNLDARGNEGYAKFVVRSR